MDEYFAGSNPIGGRVTMNDVSYGIVAVVADLKYLSLLGPELTVHNRRFVTA
jgi:hypothetical protein